MDNNKRRSLNEFYKLRGVYFCNKLIEPDLHFPYHQLLLKIFLLVVKITIQLSSRYQVICKLIIPPERLKNELFPDWISINWFPIIQIIGHFTPQSHERWSVVVTEPFIREVVVVVLRDKLVKSSSRVILLREVRKLLSVYHGQQSSHRWSKVEPIQDSECPDWSVVG